MVEINYGFGQLSLAKGLIGAMASRRKSHTRKTYAGLSKAWNPKPSTPLLRLINSDQLMTTSKTERLAQWSAIATAIIATLGLGIAMWQIQAAEKSQREASAREAFKEYLKLAIDKPEFADARLEVVSKTESGKSSYAWFVSYFMYSAEQIFQSFPVKQPGIPTFLISLNSHFKLPFHVNHSSLPQMQIRIRISE